MTAKLSLKFANTYRGWRQGDVYQVARAESRRQAAAHGSASTLKLHFQRLLWSAMKVCNQPKAAPVLTQKLGSTRSLLRSIYVWQNNSGALAEAVV